jgi:hypothetical protein
MERSVTLIQVPRNGEDPNHSELSTRIAEIVESLGGACDGIWALGEGPFQFVSVTRYPDRVTAHRARTRIEALGLTTVEGYSVFDIRESLQAMAA